MMMDRKISVVYMIRLSGPVVRLLSDSQREENYENIKGGEKIWHVIILYQRVYPLS